MPAFVFGQRKEGRQDMLGKAHAWGVLAAGWQWQPIEVGHGHIVDRGQVGGGRWHACYNFQYGKPASMPYHHHTNTEIAIFEN